MGHDARLLYLHLRSVGCHFPILYQCIIGYPLRSNQTYETWTGRVDVTLSRICMSNFSRKTVNCDSQGCMSRWYLDETKLAYDCSNTGNWKSDVCIYVYAIVQIMLNRLEEDLGRLARLAMNRFSSAFSCIGAQPISQLSLCFATTRGVLSK